MSIYYKLCRFRNQSGIIPLSEIIAYLQINNVDDIEELLEYVYELNDVHIEHENNKQKQELDKIKHKGKKR